MMAGGQNPSHMLGTEQSRSVSSSYGCSHERVNCQSARLLCVSLSKLAVKCYDPIAMHPASERCAHSFWVLIKLRFTYVDSSA